MAHVGHAAHNLVYNDAGCSTCLTSLSVWLNVMLKAEYAATASDLWLVLVTNCDMHSLMQ